VTDLDARYGRNPKKSKRNIVVLAVALVMTFFVWAFAVNFATPAEQARYSGEATKLLGATDLSISAQVKVVGSGVTGKVSCVVKALDASYALVGYKEEVFEFSGQRDLDFVLTVNTTAKASSVVLEACELK
jgi:hypothetical protein